MAREESGVLIGEPEASLLSLGELEQSVQRGTLPPHLSRCVCSGGECSPLCRSSSSRPGSCGSNGHKGLLPGTLGTRPHLGGQAGKGDEMGQSSGLGRRLLLGNSQPWGRDANSTLAKPVTG